MHCIKVVQGWILLNTASQFIGVLCCTVDCTVDTACTSSLFRGSTLRTLAACLGSILLLLRALAVFRGSVLQLPILPSIYLAGICSGFDASGTAASRSNE